MAKQTGMLTCILDKMSICAKIGQYILHNLFHWTAFQRHDRRNDFRLDKIKIQEL